MRRLPLIPVTVGFSALLLVGLLFALGFGAVRIPWGDLFSLIASKMGGSPSPGGLEVVFWQLRVPRALLAVFVGATLAVAGAMMQGLFRNPLADPGLVGVSSGAALGAVVMIVIGDQLPILEVLRGPLLIPIAAMLGAWVVTLLIFQLASQSGSTSVATLLLAGIAINAFAGAVIGLCTFLADDGQLRSLNFWMLGSLGIADWGSLAMTLPFCAILLLAAPRTAMALNALAIGEPEAGHLGFRPQSLKKFIIVLTAVGVGGCVAQTGMIGFVGLVVPHLIRLMVGPDHRSLLPLSALLGAALLLNADTLARTMVSPAEMPIGILTAAVGAPFFLALLWQQKRKLSWL